MKHYAYRLGLLSTLAALLLAACVAPGGGPAATAPATAAPNLPAGILFVYTVNGGIAGFCDRLEVTTEGAMKYVQPCKTGAPGARVVGQAPADVLARLKDLAAKLAPVSLNNPGNPNVSDNMTSSVALNGTGTAAPADADVQALYEIGSALLTPMHVAAAATAAAAAGPTAAPTAAPTQAPDAPREAIFIRAASFSNGAVHVAGEAGPAFEQTLAVKVLDGAGKQIAAGTAMIKADAGQRGPFSADVPVTGSDVALVQVVDVSARDGGVVHLASAWLDAQTTQAPSPIEALVITAPAPGAQAAGSVTVEGIADPTFEQTLLVQVYDASGKVVGQASGQIKADVGQRGPFSIAVPFTAAAAGPGRVTVSAVSPRNGAVVHAASVDIALAP